MTVSDPKGLLLAESGLSSALMRSGMLLGKVQVR